MDLRMPQLDGTEATRLIISESESSGSPSCLRILVLTTFDDDESVYAALKGEPAASCSSRRLLATSLRRSARCRKETVGWSLRSWCPYSLGWRFQAASEGGTESLARLSPRELEVLALIAQGMSNTAIREHLVLSEATVKTHVSRILMKTGCHDRAQAVTLAFRTGLVQP